MKRALLILPLTFALHGCMEPTNPVPKTHAELLPSVRLTKELIVVTHNGPNTYFVNDTNTYSGLEYDLVNLFVQDLGKEYSVKFVVVDNITEVIPTLLKGKAHVAAADLSITHLRQHLVKFSVPYQSVQQQVVFNKEENNAPNTVQDLLGKRVAVPAGTSYAERLSSLVQKLPALRWQALPNVGADELLEQVAEGLVDYTVADDHLVTLMQNYYPNLGQGMALGEPEKIAWAFPKSVDPWLYDKANVFFTRIKKDGTLRNLIDRYYGHSERLNPLDVTTFLSRSRTLLPQYIRLFKQAQETTDLDWRLLAAISYQESHWDTFNTSPTNVRGLMMLTEATADLLGVTNRLDPKQSIPAGARYVKQMADTIPDAVPEPDRTWMALAAYNIGYAHLLDARALAKRMKLNPDSWADVKKTLPLLNQQKYYSTVKYGYARGGAPVIFVESIRTYHSILEKFSPKHQPVLPSFNLAWLDARSTPAP
ncbi:MAG: membrane-bound lytic murein transglycosylase MltF [Methylophilaceae bacterium]|nr:membrane-bound lytic murein transglycosylase MltF [Methylophilaceae bacterium]